jgi:hypothetical protein
MSKTQFVEQFSPIDAIESTHSELIRAHDYSDEELYTTDMLRNLANKWDEEACNPIRSERSKKVCGLIASMCTFELAYRLGRVDTMINFYKGEQYE